ncbi:flagellar hook protein FlgE [Tianweitania sediminis]|uniref:Flagellar hook protein FlgE n=3 Tax=Tianweitania sediminis TaxID=1502156 RepID=A0A8J7RAF0_9HYPH|nr:flagellar hook protein FlgE [Tianweitania sediminis]
MGLYGMMRTGVSGMSAQANRLSTVADNIANANTTGYKRSKTEFSSLVVPNTPGYYNSGGVKTSVRYEVSKQGVLQYTTSGNDLAINGNGFFIVESPNGTSNLVRAGSFVPDGQGRLVNAAGFYLMGCNYANGEPSAVANGFNGLEVVNIGAYELSVTPSDAGLILANLPATAAVVDAARLPSTNAADASYSAKSSVVVYDNLGSEILLDVFLTKTGPAAGSPPDTEPTWEVAIYNQADASADTSFPYSTGPLATTTLNFNLANGRLTAASNSDIVFDIPGGREFTLDLKNLTQLATSFDPEIRANGNGPSPIQSINIGGDGIVSAVYENGELKALYRIPLASVPSPDQLTVMPGNVYSLSPESGALRVGFPNDSGLGAVISGALEGSNVDIAEELTDMIESQRNYTANSKVFQTGSDLLDLLVNLKR